MQFKREVDTEEIRRAFAGDRPEGYAISAPPDSFLFNYVMTQPVTAIEVADYGEPVPVVAWLIDNQYWCAASTYDPTDWEPADVEETNAIMDTNTLAEGEEIELRVTVLWEGEQIPLPAMVNLLDKTLNSAQANDKIEAALKEHLKYLALKALPEGQEPPPEPTPEELEKEREKAREQVRDNLENITKGRMDRVQPIRRSSNLSEAKTFLKQTKVYSMDEWANSIATKATKVEKAEIMEWLKICKKYQHTLRKFEAESHIGEVGTSAPDEALAAFDKIDKGSVIINPKSLSEIADADQVLTRIPQVADKDIFFRLFHKTAAGEMDTYFNPYASKDSFAYSASPKESIMYLQSMSYSTDVVKGYLDQVAPAQSKRLPHIRGFQHALADDDLEALSDVMMTRSGTDPSLVTFSFGGQGGELYGNKGASKRSYQISPLTRLIIQGKPAILAIGDVYAHEPDLREHIDKKVLTLAKSRQEGGAGPAADWLTISQKFYSQFQFDPESKSLSMSPSDIKGLITNEIYQQKVDHTHIANQLVALNMSTDQVGHHGASARACPLSSELTAPRIISDLFFQGTSLDVYSALDMVNVGYLNDSDGLARPPLHPGDDTTYPVPSLKRFDKVCHALRAVLDLRFHKKPLFIGGPAEWSKKIRPDDTKEKRQSIYWDYEDEAVEYKEVVEGGVKVIRPVYAHVSKRSAQFDRALEVFKSIALGEYTRGAVICPMREAPHLLAAKGAIVVAALPAPAPAVLSAILFIQKKGRSITLKHLYEIVYLQHTRSRFIHSAYQKGSTGLCDLIRSKLSTEALKGFSDLVTKWKGLVAPRLIDPNHPSKSGLKLSSDVTKLLRKDNGETKKASIFLNTGTMDHAQKSFLALPAGEDLDQQPVADEEYQPPAYYDEE